MTIDLDLPSTIENHRSEVTVMALKAGADLLLIYVKAVPEISKIVRAIADAVADGILARERLDAAALAVFALANRLAGYSA